MLKLAGIVPIEGRDPLRDEQLGPKAAPDWKKRLGPWSRAAGLGEGLLTAAAGPFIAGAGGHFIGGRIAANHLDPSAYDTTSGVHDAVNANLAKQHIDPAAHQPAPTEALPPGANPGLNEIWNQHLDRDAKIEHGQHMGAAVGALGGGLAGLRSIAPRTLIPGMESSGYGWLSDRLGKAITRSHPKTERMVSRIHEMHPADGLALIRSVKERGQEDPAVVKAMEDAYNTRRTYYAHLSKVAVLGLPPTRIPSDPLEDKDFAPPGLARWDRTGRRAGAALGGLAGLTAGLVGPLYVGHELGGTAGTEAAIPASIVGAPVGAGIGALAGGAAGEMIGEELSAHQSPHRHAVENIKKMTPAEGLAHIQALERAGNTHPDIIKTMKDAYEFRRRGLGHQLAAQGSTP